MAKWSSKLSKAGANVRAIGNITAAATNMRRAKVYDLMFGCNAAPADNAFIYQAIRTTTVGTGSAVTPVALNTADGALSAGATVVTDTITADPTFSGVAMLNVPLNQRASMRWVAAPGGELVIPATANNGIALALSATSTTTFEGAATYEEL